MEVYLHPKVGNLEGLGSVQVLPCQIEAPLHNLLCRSVVLPPELLAPVDQICHHGEGEHQSLEEACLQAKAPQLHQAMGLKILVCDLFDPYLLSVC